jgi:hypothetical protein
MSLIHVSGEASATDGRTLLLVIYAAVVNR